MLLPAALALLLLLPQDSARVKTSLSAVQVAAGSTTVLSIEIETSGATPDAVPVPILPPGLDLGPISDYSELQVAFPGGRRRITRREVVIIATSPGTYRIPPVEIKVGGRTLRTGELQLLVRPSRRAAATPGDATGVTLRAWAQPDTVFVGEQVLYQVEAAFPEELHLRLARPPNFEPPVSTGFWTYDLPEPITVSLRMAGAGATEVQSFRQALFPMAQGSLVVPAAHLQYELRQGLVFTPEVHALTTTPVRVQVRPLPPGAPPGFQGAVGSYTLHASLSAASAPVGEPVTLKITLQGRGNIKAVGRPPLDSIAGVDSYEGAERLHVGFAGGAVSGEKTFEWTLVPRSTGIRTILVPELSWFDPGERKYVSVHLPPLSLRVAGAGAGSSGDALAPLRLEPSSRLAGWPHSLSFLLLQAVPPLALIGLWLARRRPWTRGSPSRQPGSGLNAADMLVNDPRACVEQLALWLRARPASPAAVRLRERVRQALYAPEPPTRAECEKLLSQARALEEAEAHPRQRRGRGLPLAVAVTVGGSVVGHAAFLEGVDAYRRGLFVESEAAFTAHVARFPYDHAGWYDLGNAAYLGDERGRAAWAWLRSLQLQPRDRMARRNLRLAGAHEAERALAPRLPLSSSELAILASALWWAAAACLAVAWVRPRARRRSLAGALIAVSLLVTAGSLLLGRAFAPDRGVTLTSISLQAAPSIRAETLKSLPPGAPVGLRAAHRGWVLVRTADLREGWVEAGNVGRL